MAKKWNTKDPAMTQQAKDEPTPAEETPPRLAKGLNSERRHELATTMRLTTQKLILAADELATNGQAVEDGDREPEWAIALQDEIKTRISELVKEAIATARGFRETE